MIVARHTRPATFPSGDRFRLNPGWREGRRRVQLRAEMRARTSPF